MEIKPIKQVGIWIRVSTEDQAKGESPEHHEKRARFYTESKNWKVKEVYHLEGVSGKDVSEHPETKRMLEDIKTGHITGLIFSKLARLARNTRQLLDFADYFNKYDADLISLQESIDTSTPAGRLFYTMIAAMAQWEREEISSRVAASVPIRAKLGKPLGGAAPFGYQWKDKNLVPDPQEAPIRKLIYELFLEHKRKKTVARLLNQKGYRTRNGSKFSDTTVDRLLADPSAKGLRRSNYTKTQGNKKAWKFKPQEEWVYTEIEPIISEDLWNQCNAILEQRKKDGKKPSRKAVHLFTGLIYCHCGQKMYIPSNSPKYICYKCRNKINAQDMESIFHEQLKNFFFSEKEIAGYLASADKNLKEKQELIIAMEKEKQKIKTEMDKIMKLYLDDQITSQGFGSQYKPLEAQLKQIENQLPELQGEMDFLKIKLQSSSEIISEAKDLYSRWPQLEHSEKRNIIENIAEQIVVGNKEIEINLYYLPASKEIMVGKQRNFIPALPFCHLQIKAEKPANPAYPKVLNTLGDHIRKRRLDLGLCQSEVAQKIGVSKDTISNWETNRSSPEVCFIPKIYEFLGYAPYNISKYTNLLNKKIRLWREALGLTQEQLAKEAGVDESSIAAWERGDRKPVIQSKRILEKYFTDCFNYEIKLSG
jgi:site-specific DNA recombinase